MYRCKHFKPYELVDRETFRQFGYTSYRFFDGRLLKLADWLREKLGSCTVNDWYWTKLDYEDKSVFKWSGLRVSKSPHFKPYSMHTHGKAMDMKFRDHSADDVRQFINDHWGEIKFVTGLESITLEEGVSWVHVDVRNSDDGVNTFKP
jgi:hypothetical protein